MRRHVFLSHTNQDAGVADAICTTLERSGIKCWIAPRDIDGGVLWAAAIAEAIPRSKLMVVVFSAAADRSPQVLREIHLAVEQQVGVLPFRIEPALPSGAMKFLLVSPHWIDAFKRGWADELPTLVEHVRRATGCGAPDAEPSGQGPAEPTAEAPPAAGGTAVAVAVAPPVGAAADESREGAADTALPSEPPGQPRAGPPPTRPLWEYAVVLLLMVLAAGVAASPVGLLWNYWAGGPKAVRKPVAPASKPAAPATRPAADPATSVAGPRDDDLPAGPPPPADPADEPVLPATGWHGSTTWHDAQAPHGRRVMVKLGLTTTGPEPNADLWLVVGLDAQHFSVPLVAHGPGWRSDRTVAATLATGRLHRLSIEYAAPDEVRLSCDVRVPGLTSDSPSTVTVKLKPDP